MATEELPHSELDPEIQNSLQTILQTQKDLIKWITSMQHTINNLEQKVQSLTTTGTTNKLTATHAHTCSHSADNGNNDQQFQSSNSGSDNIGNDNNNNYNNSNNNNGNQISGNTSSTVSEQEIKTREEQELQKKRHLLNEQKKIEGRQQTNKNLISCIDWLYCRLIGS